MVNDVVIQPKTPATGSEQGNQSNVFYNIRVNGILYIPVVGAPTFNGGKVQDGAMVLSDDVLHIYAGGEWKSYVTLEYAEANFAMLNDGLLEVGYITLAGLNVTVVAPVKWRIDGVNYEKLTNTVIAIVPATADYNRIDLIYATTAGTILKIEGTETSGVAVEPTLPANTIRVAPVYINGSTVAPPAPDLSGYATIDDLSGYVKLSPFGSSQIGFINVNGSIKSGNGGLNISDGLSIYQVGNNAGANIFMENLVGGDISFSGYRLNLSGSLGTRISNGLSLLTTPTTDATPANILTWDATTKEVKKVDDSRFAKLAGGNNFTGIQRVNSQIIVKHDNGKSVNIDGSNALIGFLDDNGFTTTIRPNTSTSNDVNLRLPLEDGVLALTKNFATGQTIGANTSGDAMTWAGNVYDASVNNSNLSFLLGYNGVANSFTYYSLPNIKTALATSLQDVATVNNSATSIKVTTNDGTPTAVVRNSDLPQNVAPSSASTLALTNNTNYTFNGTTSVWTLPTIASGKLGDRIFIMNMGSGMITVNSNGGGNDIYNSGTLTNTLGVNVGEIAVFYNNGISFFRQL